MFLQHFAHVLRPLEPGVRPQNARGGILQEQPPDRIDVGMCVQDEIVLLRELHHAPRHREIGVRAVQMKFPERDVAVFFQVIFEIGDDRVLANPGADVRARAIGAQRRQYQIGRRGQ